MSAPPSSRRQLYYLHVWVGFQLAALVSLVLLTGTFAVISNEIDWLLRPELRVEPGEERLSFGELERTVRSHAPDDTLSRLRVGEAAYFADQATLLRADESYYYVHVDPYTGRVTGETHSLTVQRFLRDLHRYLFMPNVIGLPIVSVVAVALLISLWTGLRTARPWRKLAFRVRVGKGLRIAVGDFHKAAGLWSSWFFLVIALTGLWYLAELGGGAVDAPFEPARPGVGAERAAAYGPIIQDASADRLIDAATRAFPGFEPTEIQFALNPTQSATVLGRSGDPLVRTRANRVFLDPVDGRVVKVQRSKEIGTVAYLNEIADPLHFGFFGGLVTKVIWFVFGLLLSSLSLTGVWLSWKRLRSRAPSRVQWATTPILLTCLVLGFVYVGRFLDSEPWPNGPSLLPAGRGGPDAPALEVSLGVPPETPVDLQLQTVWDDARLADGRLRILLEAADGRPNLGSASATLDARIGPLPLAIRRIGRYAVLTHEFASADLPRGWDESRHHLRLDLEFVSGEMLTLETAQF